jgi:hypothetical protein
VFITCVFGVLVASCLSEEPLAWMPRPQRSTSASWKGQQHEGFSQPWAPLEDEPGVGSSSMPAAPGAGFEGNAKGPPLTERACDGVLGAQEQPNDQHGEPSCDEPTGRSEGPLEELEADPLRGVQEGTSNP